MQQYPNGLVPEEADKQLRGRCQQAAQQQVTAGFRAVSSQFSNFYFVSPRFLRAFSFGKQSTHVTSSQLSVISLQSNTDLIFGGFREDNNR